MQQAATIAGNDDAVSDHLHGASAGGVWHVRTPGRHSAKGLALLCRQRARDRTDAEDLPRMGGIDCAQGHRTRRRHDKLPCGSFRQFAASNQRVNPSAED